MAISNDGGEKNITIHFLSESIPPVVDRSSDALRGISTGRSPAFNIRLPRDHFERLLMRIAAQCKDQLNSREPRDVTSIFLPLILVLEAERVHEDDRQFVGVVTCMNPYITVSAGYGWMVIRYAPLGSPAQGKHIFCFGLGDSMQPVVKPRDLAILPNGDLYDEARHLLYPHMQAPYPLPWLQGGDRWEIEGHLHFLISPFDISPLRILCMQPHSEAQRQATELHEALKEIVDRHVLELLEENEGRRRTQDLEAQEASGFEEARLMNLATRIKTLARDHDSLVHALLAHPNPIHGLARQIQCLLDRVWIQASRIADNHFQQRRRIEIACRASAAPA